MIRRPPLAVPLAILLFLAVPATHAPAEEPVPEAERFTGTLLVVNAPATGAARIRLTVERWTTEEERKRLAEAIRAGGSDALVEALEDMKAGYVQIDNNLRRPVRYAFSWEKDGGRLVRLATDRPLHFVELRRSATSLDYPIGVVELRLPPGGEGEGTLLAAAQVHVGADGRLEVKSLPSNTGPQRIVGVRSEIVPARKSKKK